MNEYEVQHYSNYHKQDLVRQGTKEQQTRQFIADQEPAKRKYSNPLMMLLVNLMNIIA